MAKDQAAGAPARWGKKGKGRPAQPAVITAEAKKPAAPKKPFNPLQFAREVRAEARKITWPSRKETWITAVMVFIMILITIVFFFVVDLVTGYAVGHLIKIGS